ncbi:MAG: autotransporter-associated beta strand repeat-containing protein [Chthoniobacteraceae bacterium]
MAALTSSQGANTVQSTNNGAGSSSLTFSNVVARTAGSSANFVVSGGTNGSTNKIVFTQVAGAAPTTGALLDKGYYFNGADFAAYDASGYVRALAYGTDTNSAAVDTITASNNVKLSTTPGSNQNTISLLTLNLSGSGTSWVQNASQTLTLSSGGLIKSGGGTGGVISGGTGMTTGGSTELVIRTDTSSDALDIQTPILSTSTGGLTKDGAGTLTLSATGNAYTGATNINEGTVNLTGTMTGGGALTVSNATFNVSNNLTAGLITVGNRSGVSTMNLTSGTVTASGVNIANSSTGTDSATGTVNISGGTLTSTGDVAVALGGTQTGKLVMNGGTLNVGTTATKWMEVGDYDYSNGEVDLNSGTLNLNTNTAIKFSANGSAGTSVFNQNGGTVTFYSGNAATVGGTGDLDLQKGGTSATNNTYNLNGGTLIVPQVDSSLTTGSRTFNFNGGTLKAAKANTTFFNLGTGTTRANVRNGGAIIDTNGLAVTISQALLHSNVSGDNATDGGLTKNGTGTLTLTGTSTYTGGTTVNAGGLTLTGTAKLGTGSVAVTDGATLTLGSGAETSVNYVDDLRALCSQARRRC